MVFSNVLQMQHMHAGRLSNDPRNLRRRSLASINDTIFIDFGPDTHSANLNGDIELSI